MSLGDTLRAAREKAGLSVDDIMHATQMTRDQVVGLETNDYHAFSAPVYTKGFIKLFARAVGVPPQPLVAAYLANPNGTERNQPDGELPIVALETISAESGALVSVRPQVPHVAPPPPAAPVEKKVVAAPAPSPAPVPASAPAPAPAPVPAPAETEKTLLDFMEPAPAPALVEPHPEKRLAPVEPGVVPPVPPSKLVRFDDPVPKPAPAPVAKNEPEPTAVGAAAPAPWWNEVAPPVAPKPVSVPQNPFVFPGPAAPRPQPRPAPAPEPAPEPAPVKKVSPEPDPRIAAAPHPVVSSAARPAFVEDELFAPPERVPEPAPETPPAPPAPTLFPDDELSEEPDAPNPVKIFFSNLGASVSRTAAKVRAGLRARWVRPAVLGVCGVFLVAALVGLAVSMWPPAGESGPETADGAAAPDPVADFVFEGPVEIVPVLPAPRSFAK